MIRDERERERRKERGRDERGKKGERERDSVVILINVPQLR